VRVCGRINHGDLIYSGVINATDGSAAVIRCRTFVAVSVSLALLGWQRAATAAGVSPYMPLNLSPRIERQIDRAMVLAGQPVMRKPLAAARVLKSLSYVCQSSQALCDEIRAYLQPFMSDAGVTSLQLGVQAVAGKSDFVLPNEHGRTSGDTLQVSASAYVQPWDHLLLTAGGIANDDHATPTGTVISAGFDVAQLDIGYRDHWFSSMNDSSILIGTEAPTMPSVTLSNNMPLGSLGISYELFMAQISSQDGIKYFDSTTKGHPRLAGLQLGIEPTPGYGLTINRLMQYGGGARGGADLSGFIDALTKNPNKPDAAGATEEFGNQVASLASTLIVPSSVPFALKMEYAGEDNSFAGNQRLGDVAMLVGIDFPMLGPALDASYEYSEWQNVWYTHHIYPDGLTNKNDVLGHWFGDQRVPGDAVTGASHALRVGLRLLSGDYLQARYRTLAFDVTETPSLTPPNGYRRLHELTLNYSTAWNSHALDLGLRAGRGAIDGSFVGLTAAVDWAQSVSRAGLDDGGDTTQSGDMEFFVDAGAQHSHVHQIIVADIPGQSEKTTGIHLGVGLRRPISDHSAVGARLEFDDVLGRSLFSLRAVDYQYRLTKHVALNGFFGVGRYQVGRPAYGYYYGGGAQWLEIFPKWSLGFDLRYHDKMARNRVLPGDPPDPGGFPRMHFDVSGYTTYVSRRF
jgi:hypothetical protein